MAKLDVLIVTKNIGHTIEDNRDDFATFSRCRLTGTFHGGRTFKIMSRYHFDTMGEAYRPGEVWFSFVPTTKEKAQSDHMTRK